MSSLPPEPRPSPPAALARKSVGRAHLHANRLEEALEVFVDLIRQYPSDAEAHWLLGDCYLAGGDAATALQLYRQAQRIEPTNSEIVQRLFLAQGEVTDSAQAESVPTDPEAIARLLQRLTGRRHPVTKADVARAAHVLSEIVNSPRPAQEVGKHLGEIDELLPALLELNIRQARADGRPDVARALEHLFDHIALQTRAQ